MYRQSYNRGRRGMTFKFKPPKARKFNTAPISGVGFDGSASGITAARVVLIALIAVIVVVVAVIAVRMFAFNTDSRANSGYNASEDNNALLLRVVNKSNPLDKDYVPELVEKDGYSISTLAEKSLDKLLAAAEKDDVSLYVKYAYVSYKEQEKIYKSEYKKQLKKGLTEVKAQALTTGTIPQPGRSEFQTGLMVSFRSKDKGKFKNSKASDWLFKNAKKYGFVLRYPEDKEDVTSMNVNYKSYRYVGENNARLMQSLNMCLNEYSNYVNSRETVN